MISKSCVWSLRKKTKIFRKQKETQGEFGFIPEMKTDVEDSRFVSFAQGRIDVKRKKIHTAPCSRQIFQKKYVFNNFNKNTNSTTNKDPHPKKSVTLYKIFKKV